MRRWWWLAAVMLTCVHAQDWHTVGLTRFLAETDTVRVAAGPGGGMAIAEYGRRDDPNRFWIQADFKPGAERRGAVYLVFGALVDSALTLWAGGYDFDTNRLREGRVSVDSAGQVVIDAVREKAVEIRDRRDQYVFRFVFHHEDNHIRMDMNGVPLFVDGPVPVREMTHFGYLVRDAAVRFQPIMVDGK